MIVGFAQPAAAEGAFPFHFVRGAASTTPGTVCVDSYVEPALGVAGVTLDVSVNGVVRDSVTSSLVRSRRVPFADAIDYHRCFAVAAGAVAVSAVATANPDGTGGRPEAVPVLDQLLQVAEVPPPTVPAVPGKPSAQPAGGTAIRVAWGAVNDGGSDLTGYEVRVSKGGAVVRRLVTMATSLTVPGLKLNSSYAVTVRAVNGVGSSPASPAAGIELEAPGTPAKPAASASSATTVRVEWKAPKSTGGPAITGYQVRVSRGGTVVQTVDVAPDKRAVTVSGLEGRTGYSVTVRAKNGVGYSASSIKSSFTTKDWSAAAKWAAKKYGTFTTVTVSGTGDDVITLPRGVKAGILSARHSGGSNFSIQVQDKNGTTTDWAVNRMGAYSGTTVFGMDAWRGTPRQLEITASGEWTIQISAVRTAVGMPSSGKGDGVYLYGGRTRQLAVTHSGSAHFLVYTYASGASGRSHLVNAYGSYRGSVPLTKGPAVIEIVADGSWTAKAG